MTEEDDLRNDGSDRNPQRGSGPEVADLTPKDQQPLTGQNKIKSTDVFVVATWYIRTINPKGRLELLEREKERCSINIPGLAETWWKGEDSHCFPDGGSMVIHARSTSRECGVGFMLDKITARSALGYELSSNRVIALRLAAKLINITIIQCYVPTTTHKDEEVDNVYEDIKALKRKYRHDHIIIMGDFNAKVGGVVPKEVGGRHGLGQRNERGDMLVQFLSRGKTGDQHSV